jgi:hypothetical protein
VTLRRSSEHQFEVLEAIEGAARRRVLVYGSLPPHARDLDLVVHPDDSTPIATALRRSGCSNRGRQWVAFRGCEVTVVDLVPLARLRLPADEETALFAEATPLDGLSRVVEPSAHHVLLILARRLSNARVLTAKHRRRIDRVLADDTAAWDRALGRAGGWAAADALAHLQALHRSQAVRPRALRLPRRPRRTRLVALCGPDEARVSFHARALRDALERLDYDVVVERPRRLGAWDRAGAPALRGAAVALALWRPPARLAGRGSVVVYERYTLDYAIESSAGVALVRLLRFLAPRTLRTYLLDGPSDAAQPDVAGVFGARRLDLERPEGELCRELVEDVWSALERRTRLGSALRAARDRARRRRLDAGDDGRESTLRSCGDAGSPLR